MEVLNLVFGQSGVGNGWHATLSRIATAKSSNTNDRHIEDRTSRIAALQWRDFPAAKERNAVIAVLALERKPYHSKMGAANINAQSLVGKVRRLNLHSSDYAVFGSGPLVVRGIILDARDIDIICRGIALEKVRATGRKTYLRNYGVSVFTFEDSIISCGDSWAIGNPDIDKLIDEAEIIDGIPFVRLVHVSAYKKIRRSTKDVVHLRAIEKYTGQSPDP